MKPDVSSAKELEKQKTGKADDQQAKQAKDHAEEADAALEDNSVLAS